MGKADFIKYDKSKTLKNMTEDLKAAREKLAKMEAKGTATETELNKMREIVKNLSDTLGRNM